MLWNELLEVYVGAKLGDERVLAVRPHYGPGIVASILGGEVIIKEDQTPRIKTLRTAEAIRQVLLRGVPDLEQGLGKQVLQTERVNRDYLAEHPALQENIHIFLADSQGPVDTAHLLWGSEIYLAMFDEPELVRALLDLATETTIAFTQKQKALVGEPLGSAYHFHYKVPGGVRVVDDSAISLSPSMYEAFSKPYTERVLLAFGGGYMHYCGHQIVSHVQRLATRGLRGIEPGFDCPDRNPAYTLESIWR